jgi:hypothetical protein
MVQECRGSLIGRGCYKWIALWAFLCAVHVSATELLSVAPMLSIRSRPGPPQWLGMTLPGVYLAMS